MQPQLLQSLQSCQPQCQSACAPQPYIRHACIPPPYFQQCMPQHQPQFQSQSQPYLPPQSNFYTGFNGFAGSNNFNPGLPRRIDLGTLISQNGTLAGGFVVPNNQDQEDISGSSVGNPSLETCIKICRG